MNADEIMLVLRLTAMGRVGHPEQQRLCDALEKVLYAASLGKKPSELAAPAWRDTRTAEDVMLTVSDLVTSEAAPKRTRKKAE